MKAAQSKSEFRKRKRDDSEESISEGCKKAKVHAQRKFAQGSAYNTAMLTPIKDRIRPLPSNPTAGPMLLEKCPNAEDFLTYLCFRKYGILPDSLNFSNDTQTDTSTSSEKTYDSSTGNRNSEQNLLNLEMDDKNPNDNIDENDEKSDENKKSSPTVQALRKKYQEQRLAKQKGTNVTKLAQKVKGKNMIRTRSSALAEMKTMAKNQEAGKEMKASSGLRSGLRRLQLVVGKPGKKVEETKYIRAGLRSSGVKSPKSPEGKVSTPAKPSAGKKTEKEVKKPPKVEVSEMKTRNLKMKKSEGFSDFSSDDNEPLSVSKKPKIDLKKSGKSSEVGRQPGKTVKTRAHMSEAGSKRDTTTTTTTTTPMTTVSTRPMRRTKEAANVYMEILTKKLVNSRKSGGMSDSSSSSYIELPNFKKIEQQENEIKAKALADKLKMEEKAKGGKKAGNKKEEPATAKKDTKNSKEEPAKKSNQNAKGNAKGASKSEENTTVGTKKGNRSSAKEEPSKSKQSTQEKDQTTTILASRPSTRTSSRQQSESEAQKKSVPKASQPAKATQNKVVEKESTGKVDKKSKEKKVPVKGAQPKSGTDEKTGSMSKGSSLSSVPEQTGKQDQKGKKAVEKTKQIVAEKKDSKEKQEKQEKSKEVTNTKETKKDLKGKKSGDGKQEKKEAEVKKTTEKKSEKKPSETSEQASTLNKRPTRKCSTVDKIWIDIDGFTSDEEDFVDVPPASVAKTRSSTRKATSTVKEKQPPKPEQNKKSNKTEKTETATVSKSKNEKPKEAEKEKKGKEEVKKTDVKKGKVESKEKTEETKSPGKGSKSENEGKTKENVTKAEQMKKEKKGEVKGSKENAVVSKGTKGGGQQETKSKETNVKRRDSLEAKSPTSIKGEKETKNVSANKGSVERSPVQGGGKQKTVTKTAETKEKVEKSTEKEGNKTKEQTTKNEKSDEKEERKSKRLKKKSKSGQESSKKRAKDSEGGGRSQKRTRPVRQCSTGEKKWIETDSDSFSFYETSEEEEEEEDPPVVDLNGKSKVKSSPETEGTNAKENETVVSEGSKKVVAKKSSKEEKFSESDDEPLEKKVVTVKKTPETKSPSSTKSEASAEKSAGKAHREVPGLHPLKKNPSEGHLKGGGGGGYEMAGGTPLVKPVKPAGLSPNAVPETKPSVSEMKTPPKKAEGEGAAQSATKEDKVSGEQQKSSPDVSMPNRVETAFHPVKRDEALSPSFSNNVMVTFANVPYQPMPCSYQIKPMSFPPSREPISTHGLDLLSEVALPTSPNEKLSAQTERIEKWLKDSLAAEHKTDFRSRQPAEYKSKPRDSPAKSTSEKPQSELSFYNGKPTPSPAKVSSQPEHHKFAQMELLESQKLLKRNIFAAEVKHESSKVEAAGVAGGSGAGAGAVAAAGTAQLPSPSQTQSHSPPTKKAVTSVQDLLKLQKERKEMGKSPVDNSPHLKNCKCNNCVVMKGWFKNKPVPSTTVEQKTSPNEERGAESAKPFQSLTKAFTKTSEEEKNPKMSVTVAPMVLIAMPSTSSLGVSTSPTAKEPTGTPVQQQKKMSFLERMKERERKERAARKAKANAFSPSHESSVYAFEPERDRQRGTGTPFKRKTKESRRSSSEDETLKICEDESQTTTSGELQTEKEVHESSDSFKASQSASIAVQVNLDSESGTDTEPPAEAPAPTQDGKSIEISTQTEVPEEDSDSPLFYIPLQQKTTGGSTSSEQQLIQGVALKLGTEGPMGPNQRVIMKAKLVTKVPNAPSIKALVMPQPKRLFEKNPPIGTVQPTTRKPPTVQENAATDSKSTETTSKGETSAPVVAQTPNESGTSSEASTPKSSKQSPNKTPSSSPSSSAKGKEKSNSATKTESSEDHAAASSSKGKKISKQKSSEPTISPSNSTWLPPAGSPSKLVEAPTFHPTEKDFQDPFEFFDRIRPAAEKFGLCRIVPPSSFKPDCKVSDDMRFTAYNQYIHRMFHRWGPNIKEMMAIKKYLATQSISLKQPPWIGGMEVDLPRLYQSVQNYGGLMKVMEKKKWNYVADMMKIPKAAQDRVTKLDDIYCKYLLPYDTLSHSERQKLFDEVEKDWMERLSKPLESQDTQADEDGEDENYMEECEECVVKGRNMALNQFYRIARNTMSMWFRSPEPSPREVESEFWKHVSERNHHVCVHSGSIDSSGWGYGFPIAKNNSFSRHPWNLKVLTNNSGSVLRSLGPVMGVTVPTIHVGMVFTAFCWYRDPHGLPWIEYLHTGAPKIWYGISDDNSTVFREALAKLLPRYIKNKTVWLPSDTAMIPPNLLVENGVSLCQTIQEPGQFILVFPRAFTSSICTGYLVSESVYFAQPTWLTTAEQVFKDLQESSEPSMFSLEKLLFNIATDSRSSVEVLKQVLPMIWHVKQKEIEGRKALTDLGLKSSDRLPSKELGNKKKKGRWAQEEDGDYECEVCRMNLHLSLVTNSHEEGVYCLPHAIDLLTQKRQQLKYCKLMYTYTQEEMDELYEKLEQRIESKSQKKLQSKSSTSAK